MEHAEIARKNQVTVDETKGRISVLDLAQRDGLGLKKVGHEWKALCPFHSEKNPSFFIYNHGQRFHCFGCGADGDVFDYYQKTRNTSFLDAKDYLAGLTGLSPGSATSRPFTAQKAPAKVEADHEDSWIPIPVPVDAKPPPDSHYKLGKATAIWPYRNETGAILSLVSRFNVLDSAGNVTGKTDRPLTYCRHAITGKEEWRFQGLDKLRLKPPFNLDQLAANPGLPVIVCEGEKAATAAAKIFHGYIATTSMNGAASANKTDWSILKGKHVKVYPDNDEAGQRYAADVIRLAVAAGAKSVTLLELKAPFDPGPGFDAADALELGWNEADVFNRYDLRDVGPKPPPKPTYPEFGLLVDEAERPLRKVIADFFDEAAGSAAKDLAVMESIANLCGDDNASVPMDSSLQHGIIIGLGAGKTEAIIDEAI